MGDKYKNAKLINQLNGPVNDLNKECVVLSQPEFRKYGIESRFLVWYVSLFQSCLSITLIATSD